MNPPLSLSLMALGLTLLCGCAAMAQSSSATPRGEPDCSFRSATTCWTVAGRFPAQRPERGDSLPDEVQSRPATILASGADTAAASGNRAGQ